MTLRFSTRIACAAIVAASFGLTGSAFAAAKTGTLNVKLTIEDGCSVFTSTAGSDLNFGTWTTLSDTIDAQTTFQVSCNNAGTGKTKIEVKLDGGLSGKITDREMQNSDGTKKIKYGLFTESTRNTNWGDTDGNTVIQAIPASAGENVSFTVYGRVLKQSNPGSGVYTDTVKVTVEPK
ncbi:Csu type fimbrial protein [Phyllobacterium endophyticum]|uniref:Csu type fimbrial protein n=1 Tax=Phyllobacterium endophyticum TaxID=1149773 RepID=UPI0011C7E71E|nr:spore coat U domain-containing protein [Phyllobacterium endophyticum]TXR51216.1 spore coat protein U domain-containing protein [Phyllobacterium endophyticum]